MAERNGNGIWKWIAGSLAVVLIAAASTWATFVTGSLVSLADKFEQLSADFYELRGEVRAKLKED